MPAVNAVPTTPVSNPSDVKAEIDSRIESAWKNEGYVLSDGTLDVEKMQDVAYAAVRHRIATSKADKASKAITRGELYAAVFPNAPGADGKFDDLDEFDSAVAASLERDVWGLTQPKATGAMQRRLDEEGVSLVLLRATIRRNMDKAPAVYLTDNSTLIMEDSVDQEIKAFERKAENLRKEVNMIMKRHPELASKIRSELGQALNRAKAELALPTAGQVAAALPAGGSTDADDEGAA
jgi:hypothetical protein